MGTRHVFNSGTEAIFVGGKMIPPGDGRDVDDLGLPPEDDRATLQEQPDPEPDPDANLIDVLKGNVKAVVATLADSSDETLAGLARLENASETPRKGVLGAIAELQLQRAQDQSGGGKPD